MEKKKQAELAQNVSLEKKQLEEDAKESPTNGFAKIDAQTVFDETFKKKKIEEFLKNNKESPSIYTPGRNYKRAYYKSKFGVKSVDYLSFLENIKESYIQGIVWNFRYYYQGCRSWNWFYPYYYSPFISDLVNFSEKQIEFKQGEPITPFQQLLSVLPPFSAHALPEPLQSLMLDPHSEILDFYP